MGNFKAQIFEKDEIFEEIKSHCQKNLKLFDNYANLLSKRKSISKQIVNFKNIYYNKDKLNDEKFQHDILMIRGHFESSLINHFNISETERKKIDINNLNRIYILIISTNEICSACTNVVPEITKIVTEKLGIKDDKTKINLLYFPFYSHEDGKLFIKLSEEVYKKNK